MRTVEFDAEGKILGRLATQVSIALRGKDTPQYRRDRLAEVTVIVKNADKIRVTGKKMDQKMYYNFSGYPGGLKKRSMTEVLAKHPERILLAAIKRMLPANKLRPRLLKHLQLEISTK